MNQLNRFTGKNQLVYVSDVALASQMALIFSSACPLLEMLFLLYFLRITNIMGLTMSVFLNSVNFIMLQNVVCFRDKQH